MPLMIAGLAPSSGIVRQTSCNKKGTKISLFWFAAKIGLVLKAVPEAMLEQEVEGLADRLSWIDPEMLSANKRIINVGMELMGAQTLQRLAAENDARAHTTKAARNVFKQIASEGLGPALRDRDAPFGDSRARVEGPEVRDADGKLTS